MLLQNKSASLVGMAKIFGGWMADIVNICSSPESIICTASAQAILRFEKAVEETRLFKARGLYQQFIERLIAQQGH